MVVSGSSAGCSGGVRHSPTPSPPAALIPLTLLSCPSPAQVTVQTSPPDLLPGSSHPSVPPSHCLRPSPSANSYASICCLKPESLASFHYQTFPFPNLRPQVLAHHSPRFTVLECPQASLTFSTYLPARARAHTHRGACAHTYTCTQSAPGLGSLPHSPPWEAHRSVLSP